MQCKNKNKAIYENSDSYLKTNPELDEFYLQHLFMNKTKIREI